MNFKIWRQIMCFRQKRKKHNNNNNNNNNNSLSEPEIEPGTSLTPFGWVIYLPPSQLNISIEVKLLTCVSVMGRKVNKQSQIKLMKEKARKHSLHEKTAASVLLKLFISSNEWCHTTDAP